MNRFGQTRRWALYEEVVRSLAILSLVWALLITVPFLVRPWLDDPQAALVAFLSAAALLLPLRPARPRPGAKRQIFLLAMGVVTGFTSFPAWLALIRATGWMLSLAPAVPSSLGGGSPFSYVSVVLLAPVFEELLYRERLLGALSPTIGAFPAVLATSALFALSHVEPWPVLGTLIVGLGLGAVMCMSGSVALCIGAHAGLNVAAIVVRP